MSFWLSSFVNRWHTHPKLAKTGDSIAGHQARVAMIVLRLWPDASRELIIRSLIHDQGEACTGDLPYTFKRQEPSIRQAVNKVEVECIAEQGLPFPDLSDDEEKLLKLADWTDSYLWARHHEPNLVERDLSWGKQLDEMKILAVELDVLPTFNEVLKESYHGG